MLMPLLLPRSLSLSLAGVRDQVHVFSLMHFSCSVPFLNLLKECSFLRKQSFLAGGCCAWEGDKLQKSLPAQNNLIISFCIDTASN